MLSNTSHESSEVESLSFTLSFRPWDRSHRKIKIEGSNRPCSVESLRITPLHCVSDRQIAWPMVVATRITATECVVQLELREPPPCAGPSSVRIRCTLGREYSSTKLGGGGRAALDRRDAGRIGEQRFYVYDSSLFLRREDARLARRPRHAGVHAAAACAAWTSRRTTGSPPAASPSPPGSPPGTCSGARGRTYDDEGRGGDRYHFAVQIALEVRLVYSEPKAVVRACADTVMQTVVPGSGDQCPVCMEGFEAGVDAGPMCPVNLPCSHAFHTRCITVWLFKGRTCPVCRHDLTSLVSPPPWKSQQHMLGRKNW
ncbi:hypothetical protein ACP70R_037534 [Stipagrostis hirtigluma subsp. patula]